MDKKITKIFLMGVVVMVVLAQIYPIETSHALFGAGDIVSDPLAESSLLTIAGTTGGTAVATTGGWVAQAARFALDNALKIALQALKKRLLDLMTNEVLDWINNGTTPKFTQDFGSVFAQAGDAAVGDVLNQFALTQPLCQPFSFNIQFQLQQPAPFADQVRCSLSSVISNYSSYRNNFNNGGWLAYQELLKPQNNQWGVEIQTQSQIIDETNQKTNASVLQQQVNVGFNSSSCTGGWDLINLATNQSAKPGDFGLGLDFLTNFGHINPDPARAPNDPPPSPDIHFTYRCAASTITTPGSTLATGLAKATYGSFDYVISSQDLTNTLAIITDAAFNKLIKNGVNGLKDITTKAFAPTSAEVSAAQSSSEAQNYQNTQNQFVETTKSAYLNQLNPAITAILAASSSIATASATNQSIISTAQDALICLASKTSDPDYLFANSSINTATTTTRTTINNKASEINTAYSSLNTLVSEMQSSSCNQSCVTNINSNDITNSVNAASNLNTDATSILLNIQNTLNDLQTRKTKDCNL